MIALMNSRYEIHNQVLSDTCRRVAKECPLCMSRLPFPKEVPGTPILSSRFAERILTDLKKLGTLGYMLVVVCHFSTYCWLGFLSDKKAAGVANFLLDTVIPDIKDINTRRVMATREAAASVSQDVQPLRASDMPPEDNPTVGVPLTVEAMGEYRKNVLEVRRR